MSPAYFEAMGIPTQAGRGSGEAIPNRPRCVIVDKKLARRFWGDANPIGRRMFKPENPNDLTKPGPNARWFTVVGVVVGVRISGFVADRRPRGSARLPFTHRRPTAA